MARPLLTSPMHALPLSSSMPMTLFFVVLAVLSVFSVITFLCGTSKMKKFRAQTVESTSSKKHKLISKLNSNLSNRAVSMVKMLSWRKVQAEEVEEEDEGYYSDQDEEALWKKNILMGERCRPLDFSGNIVSDSEGNVKPDLPHDSHQNGHH